MGKNRIIGLYIIIVYVLFVAFSFLLPQFYRSKVNAATGINNRIHFQGKVVNSDGTNVADGTYDFVFKMYDGVGSSATALFTETWSSAALFSSTMSSAPSSGGESLTYSSNTNESTLKVGQILWNTTKEESVYITSVDTGTNVLGISPTRQAWAGSDTITNKMFVKDGIFIVELNSLNTDLSGVDFNTDTLYLGVNFNADGEMKPRIQYTSVPYAFNAEKVSGLTVTDTTGTFTLANSKTLTVNNTLTFSGTDGTSFTFPTGSGTVVTLDSTGTLTNKTIGSTGLTFSGANTDITTATNEHFSIVPNGSGGVGIGTTSPGSKLTISGGVGIGTTSSASSFIAAVAPDGGLIIEGNVGIGTTNPAAKLDLKSLVANSDVLRWIAADGSRLGRFTETSGGSGWFEVDNSSGVATFLIRADGGSNYLNSGNLGVGTTNPGSKLSLSGGLGIGTTSSSSVYHSIAAPDGGLLVEGNVGIGITNPGSKLHVSGGSVRIESTTPELRFIESDQTAPNGMWRFVVSSDVFSLDKNAGSDFAGLRQPMKIFSNENILFAGTTGNLGIGSTGPSKLTVAGSLAVGTTYSSFAAPTNGLIVQGNVGIGVSSPTERFHVSGNGIITGTLDLQGNLSDSGSDLVVADNLDPSSDATYDLGDTTTSWKDLYLTGQICFDDSDCFSSTTGLGNSGWTDGGANVYLSTQTDQVGIGTTAPGSKLSISGGLGIGTTSASSIFHSVAAPDGGLIVENSVGIGTTVTTGADLTIKSGTVTSSMYFSDGRAYAGYDAGFGAGTAEFGSALGKDVALVAGGTNRLHIVNSTGFVGLGTTAATSLLSLSANSANDSASLANTYFHVQNAGLTIAEIRNATNNTSLLLSADTTFSQIDTSNEDLKIGAASNQQLLLTLGGDLVFNESGASGSDLRIEGNTDELLFFTNASTDRVGIGTSAPNAKLDILSTSTQARLSYDSTNYTDLSVNSSGYLSFISGATNAVGRVQIGIGSSGNSTPDLFGLDVKSDTGDPAGGFEGAMYYNTSDNKFRCYQGSAWTDCIGTGGAGPWTDGTGISYLTDTAEDFAVGGTALASAFSVDVSANTARIGTGTTANAVLSMYGSDGDTGSITYTTNDGWSFAGGNMGIGTTNATSDLHVVSAASTGTAMQLAADSLSTGTGFSISSTSTAFSTGILAGIDWSPGSSTTATGDLFSINIGSNGTVGNLLNIKDNGTSLFLVSETSVISSVPTSFTAAGDVSIAYDLVFTNQTASYIKSNAPLAIEVGELWESNDLTLKTYNSGNIILDAGGKVAVGSGAVSPGSKLSVAGGVAIGTTSSSSNFHASAAPDGGLIVEGNVGIGRTNPGAKLEVLATSTQAKLSYDTSNYAELDVDSSGYLTLRSGATTSVGRIQIGVGSGGNTTPDLLALAVKSDTGDPSGFEGAMYYNTLDNKFRCYQDSGWTDCIGTGGAGPFTDGTGTTYLTDTAENLGVGTSSTVDKLAVVKSSTASGVDGVSIAFTQTDDTDATDTNAGLQIDITNSSTDADNLYGINIAGITGGNATEYALVIGSGWDRGLSVASASTFTAAVTVGSGGNTFTFDPATGPVYAGTARPAKQLKFAAEYEGATLTASGSASITGNMTADTTRDADLGWMNYYEWTSTQGSFQDYSVAIKIKLPSDFGGWATSNAVQINFATEVTDNAKNKLDVWIYNMTENPDQVVTRSLTNASSPAADWEVLTIDDSEIDDATAPDWDAADETAIIYLKSSSLVDAVNCTAGYDNGCYVRLGDITLNYVGKF